MFQNNPVYGSYDGQVIWIIGASSGIGYALAQHLGGVVGTGAKICLSARRPEPLEVLKHGSPHTYSVFPCNVSDYASVQQTCDQIVKQFGRINRVICLAGTYTPIKLDSLNLNQMEQMMKTNLMGAFYVVKAILPLFQHQSGGQLALCASVAGYVGLPYGQPYSATKAGVINLAESLRLEVDKTIDIKIINSGFVKTPLTDKNPFKMPCLITPEQAAQEIATGLLKSGFEITFPKRFTFIMKFIALLPYSLQQIILKKFS